MQKIEDALAALDPPGGLAGHPGAGAEHAGQLVVDRHRVDGGGERGAGRRERQDLLDAGAGRAHRQHQRRLAAGVDLLRDDVVQRRRRRIAFVGRIDRRAGQLRAHRLIVWIDRLARAVAVHRAEPARDTQLADVRGQRLQRAPRQRRGGQRRGAVRVRGDLREPAGGQAAVVREVDEQALGRRGRRRPLCLRRLLVDGRQERRRQRCATDTPEKDSAVHYITPTARVRN